VQPVAGCKRSGCEDKSSEKSLISYRIVHDLGSGVQVLMSVYRPRQIPGFVIRSSVPLPIGPSIIASRSSERATPTLRALRPHSPPICSRLRSGSYPRSHSGVFGTASKADNFRQCPTPSVNTHFQSMHIMQTPSRDLSLELALQACQSCRSRKRRCDKALPKCSSCAMYGRQPRRCSRADS
jgi:hypothetical protein